MAGALGTKRHDTGITGAVAEAVGDLAAVNPVNSTISGIAASFGGGIQGRDGFGHDKTGRDMRGCGAAEDEG